MFEKQIIQRNIVKVTIFPISACKITRILFLELFCIDFYFALKYSSTFLNFQKMFCLSSQKQCIFFPNLSTHKYKYFLFILIYCIFIAQIDVCSAVRLYRLCLLQNNWPVKYIYLLW